MFLNWCHTNETFEDKATFFALPSDLQVHVLHVTPKSKPRCIGYTVLTRMSPKRGLMALSTSPRAILIQVIATFVQVNICIWLHILIHVQNFSIYEQNLFKHSTALLMN